MGASVPFYRSNQPTESTDEIVFDHVLLLLVGRCLRRDCRSDSRKFHACCDPQRNTAAREGCAMRIEVLARMINILPNSFMWFFPVSAIHRSMEINRIKSLHN